MTEATGDDEMEHDNGRLPGAFRPGPGPEPAPGVRAWKSGGRPVIGYFCSFIPEELIMAAGALPWRMRATGSTGTDKADVYLRHWHCTFVRHCYDLAARGSFDFLDGVLFMNSCDHVRRSFDVWERTLLADAPFFIEMLSVPQVVGERALDWYYRELLRLKGVLEARMGVEITDQGLREAIEIRNETRRLIGRLYDLRKEDNPPVTGAEAMDITITSLTIPRDAFNAELDRFLSRVDGVPGVGDGAVRLMLTGSHIDQPEYLEVIESVGGLVVTDDLCLGLKPHLGMVDQAADDPVMALADRYLHRVTCPRMMGRFPDRYRYLKESVEEFGVHGVICEQIKLCDHWGVEQVMLRRRARDDGIGFLRLQREYMLGDEGQTRTRVQAFVEQLRGLR